MIEYLKKICIDKDKLAVVGERLKDPQVSPVCDFNHDTFWSLYDISANFNISLWIMI